MKGFESLRLNAYDDGGGVWTIGYGHTRDVKEGQACTEAEANELLRQDMAAVIRALDPIVQKFNLGINESAGLISLAFNTGAFAVTKPRGAIYEALMNGTKKDVAAAMQLWNKDDGKVIPGLDNRRKKEAAVFLAKDKP